MNSRNTSLALGVPADLDFKRNKTNEDQTIIRKKHAAAFCSMKRVHSGLPWEKSAKESGRKAAKKKQTPQPQQVVTSWCQGYARRCRVPIVLFLHAQSTSSCAPPGYKKVAFTPQPHKMPPTSKTSMECSRACLARHTAASHHTIPTMCTQFLHTDTHNSNLPLPFQRYYGKQATFFLSHSQSRHRTWNTVEPVYNEFRWTQQLV